MKYLSIFLLILLSNYCNAQNKFIRIENVALKTDSYVFPMFINTKGSVGYLKNKCDCFQDTVIANHSSVEVSALVYSFIREFMLKNKKRLSRKEINKKKTKGTVFFVSEVKDREEQMYIYLSWGEESKAYSRRLIKALENNKNFSRNDVNPLILKLKKTLGW